MRTRMSGGVGRAVSEGGPYPISHLRFIAICDSAIRRVAIFPLDHCRMKHSKMSGYDSAFDMASGSCWCGRDFVDHHRVKLFHVRGRLDDRNHSGGTLSQQAQRPCRMRIAIASPSKIFRSQTRLSIQQANAPPRVRLIRRAGCQQR